MGIISESLKFGGTEQKYIGRIKHEQEEVQLRQNFFRGIREYNEHIFTDIFSEKILVSRQLINQNCETEVVGIVSMLDSMYSRKGKQIVWVDMGGGKAIAMRQVGMSATMREKAKMINVDILDYEERVLDIKYSERIEKESPGVLACLEAKPEFIQTNSETIVLPQFADIITSIQGIQYLNNPLAAICNWYNQLTDKGILIMVTKQTWFRDVNTEDSLESDDNPSPINPFLNQLSKNGISFEINSDAYKKINIDTKYGYLIIEKKPKTCLVLKSRVIGIKYAGYSDYKMITYENNNPIIDVQEDEVQSKRYSFDYGYMNFILERDHIYN